MLFDPAKRTFLFKCQDCQMILKIELEEETDIKEVNDGKMTLECPCQGVCIVLRD